MVKHTQAICQLLSEFDHFVGLALQGLNTEYYHLSMNMHQNWRFSQKIVNDWKLLTIFSGF